MTSEVTATLIETARDPLSSDEDVHRAVQSFFEVIRRGSIEQAEQAMAALGECFSIENSARAALLALVCGVLVENGCSPAAIANPLTQRLHVLLNQAAVLCAACEEQLPAETDEEHNPEELFETVRDRLSGKLPEEYAAWEALSTFWRPGVAVYSVSAEARAGAHSLRDPANRIAEHHEAGHWLGMLLSVLEDEPILVIEPASSQGILGRISGVVDNFQLNVLLMDAFPPASSRRVPQRVAEVARGEGPQQTEDIVTGAWNLYNWQAIQSDFTLPEPKNFDERETWIWNEGAPEDIAVFEGRRAILLGPPSYERNWRCQRMFDKLGGELVCERTLDRDEVRQWLQRMIEAKQSG